MKKTNKFNLVAVAACGLLITGCADIVALPIDYETPLVDQTAEDLTNNIASVVYDALKDGDDVNGAVLDGILLKLAENKFGTYEDVKADPTKLDFANDIEDRVNEKMFDMISTGSYETRNKFSEERFAKYIRSMLYTVDATSGYFDDVVFTPSVTKDTIDGQAIHLDYYVDYIEGEIVPEIYREKLVEEYLLQEEYSTLGRSYARKVNYIAIATNSNHPEAAKYLIDTFIETNILSATADASDANLEILANAWRGVQSDFKSNEANLLEDAGVRSTVLGSEFDNTLYGDILTDYAKINDDRLLTDATAEATFTGNGAYLPSVGLEIKTNTLRKQDYTEDGWYVKNGGLSELPDAIRNRLFNIGTANGVDYVTDEMDAGVTDPKTSDYVRNIHGVNYLTPENAQQGDDRDFLLYDADSSTYYIVQIEEAVNTTKMTTDEDSTKNYTALGKDIDEIAGKVAKVLGEKDANKTTAMTFFLEQAGIVFHDEDIVAYFEENYPDIYGSN